MPLPYSLVTTISGLSVWAYDFNRNPTNDDKTTSVGTASNGDYILPVSRNFVKYNTNVHMIRMVCDINHSFPTKGTLTASGAYQTDTDDAYASVTMTSTYQTWGQIFLSNLRVVQNVIVSGLVLNSTERTPFTTTSKDVIIATQTGIYKSSNDFAYVVFTIADNASIPANSTITVNGKEENPYTGSSDLVSMTPITYTIPYAMQAGSYIMRIAGDPAFISASIDFPTVTTTPEPTTTTTTPTTPAPAPTQLDTLKNSLRIPLDLTDDDMLLNGYLNSAKAYILNACDSDADKTSIVIDPRFQIAQIEIATLMYENRGSDKAANGFPYTLQVLINQLRFV